MALWLKSNISCALNCFCSRVLSLCCTRISSSQHCNLYTFRQTTKQPRLVSFRCSIYMHLQQELASKYLFTVSQMQQSRQHLVKTLTHPQMRLVLPQPFKSRDQTSPRPPKPGKKALFGPLTSVCSSPAFDAAVLSQASFNGFV